MLISTILDWCCRLGDIWMFWMAILQFRQHLGQNLYSRNDFPFKFRNGIIGFWGLYCLVLYYGKQKAFLNGLGADYQILLEVHWFMRCGASLHKCNNGLIIITIFIYEIIPDCIENCDLIVLWLVALLLGMGAKLVKSYLALII